MTSAAASYTRDRVQYDPRLVLIEGQRGCPEYEAENTLRGFLRAAALGCDGVAMDVRLTADGVPVVLRDPYVQHDQHEQPRTTAIDQLTADELPHDAPLTLLRALQLCFLRGMRIRLALRVRIAVRTLREVLMAVGAWEEARACAAPSIVFSSTCTTQLAEITTARSAMPHALMLECASAPVSTEEILEVIARARQCGAAHLIVPADGVHEALLRDAAAHGLCVTARCGGDDTITTHDQQQITTEVESYARLLQLNNIHTLCVNYPDRLRTRRSAAAEAAAAATEAASDASKMCSPTIQTSVASL